MKHIVLSRRRFWLSPLILAALTACSSAPPVPPRIERLPESAAMPGAVTKSGPYSTEEIVAMARQGDPAAVIVQKLRDSRTPYGGLSAEQSASLGQQGVPSDVLVWLRHGDRTPAKPAPYTGRYACLRDPFCRPLGYGHSLGYPFGYPYRHAHPPYGSGLYFRYGWRR